MGLHGLQWFTWFTRFTYVNRVNQGGFRVVYKVYGIAVQ